jgi:hypothetical protein
MVWRVSYVRDGTTTYDATPYQSDAEAMQIIRGLWKHGFLDTARIEDHNGNPIEWDDIKKRLESSN